ncbi:sn-glycerol-3-phosphate ABC transporter ATP-binding protein UgpC [Halobacteria archaeon AArc-m2/3/4]|uniref:Sn-glycerol-3-phosphate ABC transporter ATP-binding protein UgpC n=1 Tax=Natronoglomus mannanivorans TaxID=2979990 RepID=A0ABT2QJM5_9EURY|nr:sn-glycerol-3-phosphate ABC transporter ATP-binding protein UgpC [Halobacteria archaeon AArc-m2/3/4]
MGHVELAELTKVFDNDGNELVAVNDLNIEIEDGEFLVLVGPSGCGKSTTLRCVAGLERTTRGEIWIGDEEVSDKKPKNRDIAMVFQNYALYPHMSARENMAFGLKISTDLSPDEISTRVDNTAEMMGIQDLLEKKPGELSGGQQQRVALGRAIVRDPEVFLMDEPLSNLDAKLRSSMRTELQDLQQELGVTTVYVTHDQVEAMTMGDRIAILNHGELCQVGTPLECYHHPDNRFVASFIGSPSMNFFDAEIQYSDVRTEILTDSFEYTLSESTVDRLTDRVTNAVLGIRPEDIRLASDDVSGIQATVTVTEPIGERTYVYLEIGDLSCTASMPGNLTFKPGEEIEIDIPEERIHLFDQETDEAVLNRVEPDDQAEAYSKVA